ncbi:LysM peptidoglycan-binding domain-containing protein [Radiobacillus kanasensis]|uniref:C40 family peptidase n=1 Tax=Radiobacillus kanasensis TaxID=2844358 RepID=UPI001E5B36BD|nr:peptidoglycan endopeptidase [Radiobacillus kanasensis]UFT98862.1 LysM peptidoglycan-binding domain-containing protein [Radiobacillus kanasensis]
MQKKTILSVAATAVVATTIFATPIDAATYKVKKGDSLWRIAQKYNTGVTQLKTLNKLKSTVVFPNQVLTVATAKTSSKATKKPTVKKTVTKSKATGTTSTYKVKSGDSLSKIAAKHKITLKQLIEWNKLKSTVIYPGNVLIVSSKVTTPKKTNTAPKPQPKPVVKPKPVTNPKPSISKPISTTVYTVKAGDSLWKISQTYKIGVEDLKKWNKLKTDSIYVGQKLKISKVAKEVALPTPLPNEVPSDQGDYNVTKLIAEATALFGTPYQFGGSTPVGFDCSGFIFHVFNLAGKDIARYSSEGYYNRSFYVNKPQLGDLVFFENTYKKGISHVGIYAGNNTFIHAGETGVTTSSLTNSYWNQHFDGFKRLY